MHKIIDVTRARVATESVVMPLVRAAPPVPHALNDLCPTDKEELQMIIQSRPIKCCSLDVLLTWLLKNTLPVMLPTLVSIVNASLKTGVFPKTLKTALVTALLKKASLDRSELKNYRPISNLALIEQMIEQVVLKRINLHMVMNKLHDKMQSAYR